MPYFRVNTKCTITLDVAFQVEAANPTEARRKIAESDVTDAEVGIHWVSGNEALELEMLSQQVDYSFGEVTHMEDI